MGTRNLLYDPIELTAKSIEVKGPLTDLKAILSLPRPPEILVQITYPIFRTGCSIHVTTL